MQDPSLRWSPFWGTEIMASLVLLFCYKCHIINSNSYSPWVGWMGLLCFLWNTDQKKCTLSLSMNTFLFTDIGKMFKWKVKRINRFYISNKLLKLKHFAFPLCSPSSCSSRSSSCSAVHGLSITHARQRLYHSAISSALFFNSCTTASH